MDRLSMFLTLPIGAMLVGSLVIGAFAMGFYGWTALVVAVTIGLALCWPVSYLVARKIKQQDPDWNAPDDRRRHNSSLPKV